VSQSDPHPLETMSEAATAMNAGQDLPSTLEEIVRQAQRCLPEFEHVSVSRIHPGHQLETLAATTTLARAFDTLQSEAREGPCAAAAHRDEIITVRHAPHEQRWPTYMAKALRLGLRSQVGVSLFSDANDVICLNLHSTTHEDIDPGSIGVAEHFAVHAGLALGHVMSEEQLHTAIGSRTLIGTAIGIVMARYTLNQEKAFAYLVRESSRQNRKVRVVASDIVAEAESEFENLTNSAGN